MQDGPTRRLAAFAVGPAKASSPIDNLQTRTFMLEMRTLALSLSLSISLTRFADTLHVRTKPA